MAETKYWTVEEAANGIDALFDLVEAGVPQRIVSENGDVVWVIHEGPTVKTANPTLITECQPHF